LTCPQSFACFGRALPWATSAAKSILAVQNETVVSPDGKKLPGKPSRIKASGHEFLGNSVEIPILSNVATSLLLANSLDPSAPLRKATAPDQASELGMASTLSPGEEAQLAQTIEMFEVITQSQPNDYQSLEILKEAYSKLGREKDAIGTSKR